MAKSIAQSCPLCLSVNDPADMLDVTMAHSTPPQSAPMHLCRLCVEEILRVVFVTDLVDPSEVFAELATRIKATAPASVGPGDDDERDPAVVAAVDQENKNGGETPASEPAPEPAKEE